ncbi:MAG: hypothetical protein ABSE81_00845 [Candidatus Omnitrophota bacterium]|jgi:predicted nuclease with TOPRIM domain
MSLRKLFSAVVICFLIFSLTGCEAFTRKFTRKKKDVSPQEELVLVPEVYKNTASKEEQYRQYFIFWKAEHGELIEALLQNKPNKKKVKSAQEAIKHLENMKSLLNEAAQKQLNGYIARLKDILDAIGNDTYGGNNDFYRVKAENIERDIMKDFSYNKIKNSLL